MNKYGNKYNVPAKHLDLQSLSFSVFTPEDIKNLSVKKITSYESFNNLGYPLGGGLYDPALGPVSEKSEPCRTCRSNIFKCPGHFGQIDLPMPVVNPLFHKALQTVIKFSCLNCFMLQIPAHSKMLLSGKLRLLQDGFISSIEGLEQEVVMSVDDINNVQEYQLEQIQNAIDNYIENCHNREQSKSNETKYETTKNLNMQWFAYLDHFLKQFKSGKRNCIYCRESIPKITVLKNKIMYTKIQQNQENIENPGVVLREETTIMMPDQSKEYLRKIWKNEKKTLSVFFPCLKNLEIQYPTDVFFFDVIPVLPPVVRPVNFLDNQLVEHPQTQVYRSIMLNCLAINNIIKAVQVGDTNQLSEAGLVVYSNTRGDTAIEKLHNAWQELQTNADHLMDRDMSKTNDSANCQGLKQVIEKKEGVIRMHMMGKRVNYAARSVITPDPNLNIDEIGVPETFAMKLTYPVSVTPMNVAELRQMVLNGPDVHPGAVMVESEDGFVTRLTSDEIQRVAIAKRLLTSGKTNKIAKGVKVVYRHLQNGDMMLLNRQPTLHKPSIMAHKARILKGEKTLRLHYANCKAYNADFDGDEMNAHLAQNELARAEGYCIANVSNQYLVPKDGTPLSGLIQDHMISGVRLTLRGNFFTKDDYMQLVFAALSVVQGKLTLLPPSIVKPVPMWSGKQVLSTIIINIIPRGHALINLSSTSKIKADEWKVKKARPPNCGIPLKNPTLMSEAEVIIRNGELLCGVLDKQHYGATTYGLIHCIFELYGGSISSKMLSAFGKVFQSYLQTIGFTLGIEDILVKTKSDIKRLEIIEECRKIGEEAHRSVLELPENTPRKAVVEKMEESYFTNPKFRAQVDRKFKSIMDIYTNKINKTCLPLGLIKPFPMNNLQLMILSGAKGSMVNAMQISCLLGQIELEGKRPPLMISGKSLPSFAPYDASPRAGGFVDGRFMTGIQPQEFFFHCMAGREGLIDTAVKTSRSGYLQRCLIKHLEGVSICYDSTVRDSDGSLIQVHYGEDGLDVLQSRFLNNNQIQFLIENKDAIADKKLLKTFKSNSEQEKILKHVKKITKWQKKKGDPLAKSRMSAFSNFSAQPSYSEIFQKKKAITNWGRSKASISVMKKWIQCDENEKQYYQAQIKKCPDPVNSQHNLVKFGVLPEKFENMLNEYLKNNSTLFATSDKKEEVRDVLCAKVVKSLCPPGEPVGLLAAQSIGEPSTQMTLNTFHFAGRGEMNVTLGIPRLREILMMASKNIKTPSMEIPFRKDVKNLPKQSNKVRLKLSKCYLSNVLKTIVLTRELADKGERQMQHTFMIEFLPYECYKNEFCTQPKDVITKTELVFFKEIFREIKKSAKSSGTVVYFKEEKTRTKVEDSKLDEYEAEGPVTEGTSKFDLGEMHESSDEEEVADDADATVSKVVSRHQENQEYDEPESEEEEPDVEQDEEIDEKSKVEKEKSDVEDYDDDSLDGIDRSEYQQRKLDIVSMYAHALEYDYDVENYTWCKLKFWLPMKLTNLDIQMIVKKIAKKVVLWETPCIKKAFTFENQKGEMILKTDGINIVEMFKYNEILDLHRLYSNDIYAISQTYGIEAANRVIVREVKDVFRMYGITVDTRHLSLIADYMTYDGRFQPLSRKGMEVSASPLQQMTFESSLSFLIQATLQGKCDYLASPSSRLMVGQPCKTGTGSFDLLADLRKYLNPFSSKPIAPVSG